VGSDLAGRGVVAGDDHHVGAEVDDGGDHGVEGLDGGHLAVEVAVFAGGVRVLVVQEEVVEAVPVLAELGDLAVQVGRRGQYLHAHQPGDAPVHRIDGDGRGRQPVALVHGRELEVG